MLLDLYLSEESFKCNEEIRFANTFSVVNINNGYLLLIKSLNFTLPANCELELFLCYDNGDEDTQRNFLGNNYPREIELQLSIVSVLSSIKQIKFRFHSTLVKTTIFICKIEFEPDGRKFTKIKRLQKQTQTS